MSANWWKVARLELTLAFRDRESVAWSLIAPIVMAWLFPMILWSKPPGPTVVALVQGDNPAWVGTMFAGYLEAKGIEVGEGEDLARVAIPDSLVARLVSGEAVEASVYKSGASQTRTQQVAVKVREILYTLAFRAREEWLSTPPGQGEIDAMVAATGPIYLESSERGGIPKQVDGHVHQLPAMLVMFILFQLTTFFLVLWVEDVGSGKIRRIVMSPTRVRDLFLAQLVARLVWGLMQVVVILGVGSLVIGVHLEVPWLYFGVMLLTYMVTAISLGLLLGTFFRSPEKANAVGIAVALLFAALGGCWWPLEVVGSPVLRGVALALPTGAMMDAVGDFIAVGRSAPFPRLNFTVLFFMSAVMMPIAISRMRRQITSQEGES